MNSFRRDIPSLKRQSERFKTEIAALKTEIQSLRSERDALRIEVNYEHDQNTYLHEVTLQSDLVEQGRANRRIWVLEQENAILKKDLEMLRSSHQEDLEKEVGISNGLRGRIGTLDEKRGKALRKLEELEGREMSLKGEIEALRISSRIDIERLERDLEEARATAVTNMVEGEKQAGSQNRVQVLSVAQPSVITRYGKKPVYR